MKTFRLLILTLLAVVSLAACGDDDEPTSSDTTEANGAAGGTEQTELNATLTGGVTEVPAPGDPDGTGSAVISLDAAKGEVCYDITVENIAAPAAAHIHEGAAGAAGGVVITFDPAMIGKGKQCLTGQKEADITRIGANPAGFYVNVHTADFPGGAVRGQLEG